MGIYGYERGKDTEKDVKHFFGLAETVSGAGEIDAIYNGVTMEIKRRACVLYEGKRFNRYRNAQNAIEALIIEAEYNTGSALTRSERLAYSTDGTIEHTFVFSTGLFLLLVRDTKAAHLYRYKNGTKQLRIIPNKKLWQAVAEYGMPLIEWRNMMDGIE